MLFVLVCVDVINRLTALDKIRNIVKSYYNLNKLLYFE